MQVKELEKSKPFFAQPKKQAFLAALALTGNISEACKKANVARSLIHHEWRKDAEFNLAEADAMEDAADLMVKEARRRAIEGTEEPVYQEGRHVGSVQRYSDTLLIFLLKGERPKKYRDNFYHEHVGRDGGPIQTASLLALTTVPTAMLEQMHQTLLEKMK